jgi:hypothetical protein
VSSIKSLLRNVVLERRLNDVYSAQRILKITDTGAVILSQNCLEWWEQFAF